MKYENIVRTISETPWAIMPGKLAQIVEVVNLRASGVELSEEEIAARIGARHDERHVPQAGAVAVLPLIGVISQRMNMFMETSGGTSTELFGAAFRQMVADPSVGTIVIDVDSPGGSVSGVPELAQEIFKARGSKPIIAVANSLAASAAYWIATAADELVVTPSSLVGSIGVLSVHEDWSKMLEMKGVDHTIIQAGRFKSEGNPFEPLSDEARADIQKKVDTYYDMFVTGVAHHRGATKTTVLADFGQGRVFNAEEAVALGMADRIGTLGETIARLVPQTTSTGARAELAVDETAGNASQDDGTDRRNREVELAASVATRHGRD